jgi:hypothetical protein
MSTLPPEITKYYALCSTTAAPICHLSTYLKGKQQVLIVASDFSKYMVEKGECLIANNQIVGAHEKYSIIVF